MTAYTLLADENSRFSKDPAVAKAFRAHVVYNIITQGTLTFSDNQVMSSPNLRQLLRSDGIVRELVKNKAIQVAVRDPEGQGPQTLPEVFEAFRIDGKIPPGLERIENSPEIEFVEQSAVKVSWDYNSVRSNFTDDCRRVLLDQARDQWSDSHFEFLRMAILEEEEADQGLGRIFLQGRLPDMIEQEGIMRRDDAFAFLTRCTDAVYLSNLPKTIGLDPIYAEEHRDSFMLLRGGSYELKDYGDPIDLKPKLDHAHFTHGLNMLDVDDIAAIHASSTFKAYRNASVSASSTDRFEELFVLYGELNREIEDRMIQRFRELKRHSPAPDPRKIQRRYGSWVSQGVARLMDVLSIASIVPGAMGVPLGWGANLLVDVVNRKINPERRHADAAMHELEKAKFAAYLRAEGKADKLSFEQNVVESDGFKKEVIIS